MIATDMIATGMIKAGMTEAGLIGQILAVYLVIMNLVGLLVMAADKSKARRKQWRIKEKTLFLISLLGGSLGTWAGMYLFHHKTKHWYFVIGMPLILVLQLAMAFPLYRWILG